MQLITIYGDVVEQKPLDISESFGVNEKITVPPTLKYYLPIPSQFHVDEDERLFPVVLNPVYRKWKKQMSAELVADEIVERRSEPEKTERRKTSLIQKLDRFLNFSDLTKNPPILSAYDEWLWYDSIKITGAKTLDIVDKTNVHNFETVICKRKAFTIVTIFEGLITFDRYRPRMFSIDGMSYKQLFEIVNKKINEKDEDAILKRVRAYYMLLTIGQGQLGIEKELIYPKIRAPLRSSVVALEPPKQTVEKTQQ